MSGLSTFFRSVPKKKKQPLFFFGCFFHELSTRRDLEFSQKFHQVSGRRPMSKQNKHETTQFVGREKGRIPKFFDSDTQTSPTADFVQQKNTGTGFVDLSWGIVVICEQFSQKTPESSGNKNAPTSFGWIYLKIQPRTPTKIQETQLRCLDYVFF